MRVRLRFLFLSPLLFLVLLIAQPTPAQRGTTPASKVSGFTLFGDVEVTEGADGANRALIFDLLLYSRSGVLLDRQKVGSKGRYRFVNVPPGDYDLVIEFENAEVARTHVRLIGVVTDVRQDLTLEWRPGAAGKAKASSISAADAYVRREPNRDRFEKGQEAFDKRQYDKAVMLFTQIVSSDPHDFQAWSELGTVHLVQKDLDAAEKSYLQAIEVRPTFFRALLNLGKVRLLQKNFDGATTVLDQAVTSKPTSAEANYFLGEAYLQIKKGSKAVAYLSEALKLEPIKMAEAHLRLALLYNAAGMKNKAAAEYEQFLKKRPDYPDRKKLEQYIAANKKS